MMNFTNFQSSILTGLLLSDGTLVKRNTGDKAGAYFSLTQTANLNNIYVEAHIELLIFVFEVFKDFTHFTEPKFNYAKVKSKSYKYIYFNTFIDPLFTSLHKDWYENKIKVVPSNISQLLNPIALAFWAMGDGGKCGPGFHLNTVAFKKSDIELLVNTMNSNFNINCTIHSRNRIYISSKELPKFKQIVTPYFLTKFKYKLI
jgi:hypothetical protein